LIVIHRTTIEYSESYVALHLRSGLSLAGDMLNASLKRRAEFLAGRYCAIQCYKFFDESRPDQPGVGLSREPVWKEGYQGAISHCDGLAIATITSDQNFTLGIDVETWLTSTIASRIEKTVCNESEILLRGNTVTRSEFVTIMFSAKESLYKALFPIIKHYLGFNSCELVEADWGNQSLFFRMTYEDLPALLRNKEYRVDFECSTNHVETLALVKR
jgi:enterobactin synthetase component D